MFKDEKQGIKTNKSLQMLVKDRPPLYDYEFGIWRVYSKSNKKYIELSKGVDPSAFYGINRSGLALFFKDSYKLIPGAGRNLESWCMEDYTEFKANIWEGQKGLTKEKPPIYDSITHRWAYYNNSHSCYYGNFDTSPHSYYDIPEEEIQKYFKNSYKDEKFKGRGGIIENLPIEREESKDEEDLPITQAMESSNKRMGINENIEALPISFSFSKARSQADVSVIGIADKGQQEEMVQIPKPLFNELMDILKRIEESQKKEQRKENK